MSQGHGVDRVGLGKMSHAAGELAGGAWIDHGHQQAVAQQEASEPLLPTAGRLEHHQANAVRLERHQQAFEPLIVIG